MKLFLVFLLVMVAQTEAWGMGKKPIDLAPGKVNYAAFPRGVRAGEE
jgi:hypothetical protein